MILLPVDRKAERRTTMLETADPSALAERCWNAGFTVDVGDPDAGEPLSVLDPFGHRIQLVALDWHNEVRGEAG